MQRNELRTILQGKFPRERTYLLPVLHFLHHQFGYLPDWALQVVGWHLRVPASEVYGAATSYTELRVKDPGRHLVRVCTGLSCWHQGGRELQQQLRDRLEAHAGGTSPDAGITLAETPCGFLCPLAPAVEIDGRWHGRVTAEALARRVAVLAEDAAGGPGEPAA